MGHRGLTLEQYAVPSASFVDGTLTITGPLVVETVQRSLDASRAWFQQDVQVVDLGQVGDIDSAALALILEWKSRHPKVRFTNPSSGLCDLARLSDVQEILNWEGCGDRLAGR